MDGNVEVEASHVRLRHELVRAEVCAEVRYVLVGEALRGGHLIVERAAVHH